MQSAIEMSFDDVRNLVARHVELTIAKLEKAKRNGGQIAIELVTKRRWFGLKKPLAVNPTAEEAMAIAKKELNFYGYTTSYYKARRVYSQTFLDMIDHVQDQKSKFLMSVEDYSKLMNGEYSSNAWFDSNSWDSASDPNITK